MDVLIPRSYTAILLLFGILSFTQQELTGAQSIGVCNGRDGDNLPSQQEVVDLYKSNGITRMRIYYPDPATLEALRGSNIELILDVPNDKLQDLSDSSKATDWFNTNVKSYSPDVKFRYIAVGNEIEPSDTRSQFVLQAMQNIKNAISSSNLQGQIKVSTAIKTDLVTSSYPPSSVTFTDSAIQYIRPIINFLKNNNSPLLANVYPYFAYIGDQQDISLEYALFTKQGTNDAGYQNIFDALLDNLYYALEKEGASDLNVVVSESGWPSDGGVGASVENAGTYYRNLINHVKGGTVKKPNGPIETYLFAMFDENLKNDADTEKHFGLFRPDKSPKYQLSFN